MHLEINNKNFDYKLGTHQLEGTKEEKDLRVLVDYRMTMNGPIIYKTYLKTEYSDENIEFWLACETYKKIESRRKRISVAKRIFKNYIQPQAPKEINIDSPAREAIIRNIQEPTQSCFDEAQRIVYMHMERDSYPRFLGSEIYQKLRHSN
uniref:Regulator of G protein signaling 13 n=1 Tax=Chelonoidis abingdonii TaxID=106734 RepID=A0A8C0GM69_CHEAB